MRYLFLLLFFYSGLLVAQENWATPIKHEVNLYRVDTLLYRSEQLQSDDLDTLHDLRIKTLINLRYFIRNANKKDLKRLNIQVQNHPLFLWNIKTREIAHILFDIEEAQKQGAVLVHCYHGADRTGIIIAMYRILYQEWAVEEAKREMVEGPHGYHSIWKKSTFKFFDLKKIDEIKAEIERLRSLSDKKQCETIRHKVSFGEETIVHYA